MTDKEFEVLSLAFAAEVGTGLGTIDSPHVLIKPSKTINKLIEDGLLEKTYNDLNDEKGALASVTSGYTLTQRGMILYCGSCSSRSGDIVAEESGEVEEIFPSYQINEIEPQLPEMEYGDRHKTKPPEVTVGDKREFEGIVVDVFATHIKDKACSIKVKDVLYGRDIAIPVARGSIDTFVALLGTGKRVLVTGTVGQIGCEGTVIMSDKHDLTIVERSTTDKVLMVHIVKEEG